jgi:spore maturation protein CgeB
MKRLRMGGAEYLRPEQVPGFDLYLSFTAGPILQQLQSEFGARKALPLYCSFEPELYHPKAPSRRFKCDLSYMGTYAADRQPKLEELFTNTAKEMPGKRFLLAGPQYPATLKWPRNVKRINHLSPGSHGAFYSSSRLTLNLTRADMVGWGFSPSVRLFEAAACGCPIVSDPWPGLDTVLRIGEEVLLAEDRSDVIRLINDTDDSEMRRIGERARSRVLEEHSASRRAQEFEHYVSGVRDRDKATSRRFTVSGARASIVQSETIAP